MKNFLLSLIMLAGILQAKAQQKLTDKSPLYPNPTLKIDSNLYKLAKPRTDSLLTKNAVPLKIVPLQHQNLTAAVVYDHMPIARPNGYSRMPIVQTDVTGYTMPVAGMNLSRVYTMKRPVADTLTVHAKPQNNLSPPPVGLKPGN